jgi:hypothetical protein
MLAALSVIAAHWRGDPAAEIAVRLAEQSRDPEVRAKIARSKAAHLATPLKNE